MTNILMILITIALFATLVVGAEYKDDSNHFFDLKNTNALRGFWCIVIVLAHIIDSYSNPIQDAIGSFAFIGVTFFFMTSAYGLRTGVSKDEKYIKHFWKKRLLRLLVPCLISNIIIIISSYIVGDRFTIDGLLWSLRYINIWVKLLLLCYVIFYLVYLLGNKLDNLKKDLIICVFVLLYSLFSYLNKDSRFVIGWPYELLGFSYGLLLFDFKDKFVPKVENNWKRNTILLVTLCFIVGLLYLKFKTVYFVGEYVLKVILGIVVTLLTLCLNTRISLGNKVNRFLGHISFDVYLLHNVAFKFLIYFVREIESGVFIVLSLIITIILSYIAYLVSNLINKKVFKI